MIKKRGFHSDVSSLSFICHSYSDISHEGESLCTSSQCTPKTHLFCEKMNYKYDFKGQAKTTTLITRLIGMIKNSELQLFRLKFKPSLLLVIRTFTTKVRAYVLVCNVPLPTKGTEVNIFV